MIKFVILPFLVLFAVVLQAQQDSTKKFLVDGEFRPRFEFRKGYRTLPTSSNLPAYFVSGRTRLNFTYQEKRAAFYASIQDVRVWEKMETLLREG